MVAQAARQQQAMEGIQLSEPWELYEFKNSYIEYINSKQEEIDEQKDARRYYHNNSQLSEAQLAWYSKKNMAPIIDNQIQPNINTMAGFMQRVKGDPKAYPNTPQHQQGSDLASLTINTSLDATKWDDLYMKGVIDGAVDGIAGVEKRLMPSDRYQGDYDTHLFEVDPADYFYDPRTSKCDFSDASYDGVGKWFRVREAVDTFAKGNPEIAEMIRSSASGGSERMTSYPDKDHQWFRYNERGELDKVRIAECWYKSGDGYRWGIFTGAYILYDGIGYFYDGRGNMVSKYTMYAASRDNRMQAYGFVRDMKYLQDQLNANLGYLYYDMKSRRLLISGDVPQGVEEIREEWARPDGVVVIEEGADVVKDDKTVEIQGSLNAIADSRAQLARFNMDTAAQFEGDPVLSGRAINMLQQAAMARLGPFTKEVKNWKIRVYEQQWAQIQRYWSAERWIRTTDPQNPDEVQGILVNTLDVNPNTGERRMVNVLGELDVDIKLDEGADYINAQEETFEKFVELAKAGVRIPDQALIQLSPLDWQNKKMILDDMAQAAQPDPMAQQAMMMQLQKLQAEVEKLQSETAKNIATAEQNAPNPLDTATQIADIENTQASTAKLLSDAYGGDAQPQNPLSALLDMAQKQADIGLTKAKTVNEFSNAINNGRDVDPLGDMERMARIRKTDAETDKIDMETAVRNRPDPQPDQMNSGF